MLDANTFEAVCTAILRFVDTKCAANSTILRPLIKAVITEWGHGDVLEDNGGLLKVSRSWICKLCKKLKLSVRKATTAAYKLPRDLMFKLMTLCCALPTVFSPLISHKLQWSIWTRQGCTWCQHLLILELELVSRRYLYWGVMTNAKSQLCLQWQQTGICCPLQVIWKGKTSRSLPLSSSRDDAVMESWVWNLNEANHWSNMETMKEWVAKILVRYCEGVRMQLGLASDQKFVLLMDCWTVHKSVEFRTWLRETYTWLIFLYVPANCTSKLQPCDVIVQRPLKHGFKHQLIRMLLRL